MWEDSVLNDVDLDLVGFITNTGLRYVSYSVDWPLQVTPFP